MLNDQTFELLTRSRAADRLLLTRSENRPSERSVAFPIPSTSYARATFDMERPPLISESTVLTGDRRVPVDRTEHQNTRQREHLQHQRRIFPSVGRDGGRVRAEEKRPRGNCTGLLARVPGGSTVTTSKSFRSECRPRYYTAFLDHFQHTPSLNAVSGSSCLRYAVP